MGVVVFSLFNLFFSIESRDRRESVFSLGTFADRTCIVTTGASLFLLVMATVLAPCQAILKTTALDVDQWLLCAAVALSIIAVTEIRKAFLRKTVGPVRLRRSSPGRAGAGDHATRYEQRGEQEPQDAPPGVAGTGRHDDDSDARQHGDRDPRRAREGQKRPSTGGRGHRDAGSGRAGGQIPQQVPQLAPGPGGKGPAGSVFELVGRQPARLEVLTQVRQDRVAVGIGSLHLCGGVVPWRGVHVSTVLGGRAPPPMPDATGWT
jgi:hypothetical protein